MNSDHIHRELRMIQLYIALSQGTLYNPKLSEMIRKLMKNFEPKE